MKKTPLIQWMCVLDCDVLFCMMRFGSVFSSRHHHAIVSGIVQKSKLYQKWNETKIEKKCRTLSNKLYIFLFLVLVWCCSSTFSEPICIFLSLIHGICATWMIWTRKQQTEFCLNEWYSVFFSQSVGVCVFVSFLLPIFC